ncbi:MAG: transposase [Sulfitobacter sp.]|nr:transposase [Sulfitobacter sp.]
MLLAPVHPNRPIRPRGGSRTRCFDAFDEIFRTEGLKILKSPIRTPVANAFAERWIATLRRELLDRTIIWNQRQLKRLVIDYIGHYNTHRPHRSLDQRPPRHETASRRYVSCQIQHNIES